MAKISTDDKESTNRVILPVNKVPEAVIILGFIALWTVIAINRLENFEVFVNTMYTQPFSQGTNTILIILVPVTEFSATILLLFAHTRKAGLYVSFGLMLCYTIYILLMLSRIFGSIPCSCSSPIPGLSWVQHFWFNLILSSLAALAIFLNLKTTKRYRQGCCEGLAGQKA